MGVIAALPGLVVPRQVVGAMLAHARTELPNEACGLLAGDASSGAISAYHPGRNALRSPLRFDLDADDLVRITFAIEAAGEDLVAIFHSHVSSPAVPSRADAREARYPVPYVITGFAAGRASPELRAWTLVDGRVGELAIRVGP